MSELRANPSTQTTPVERRPAMAAGRGPVVAFRATDISMPLLCLGLEAVGWSGYWSGGNSPGSLPIGFESPAMSSNRV